MRTVFIAISISLAVAGTARGDDDDASLRALKQLEHREPTAREAVAAALRYAGLSGHPEKTLRRRARLAAALPTLSVKLGRTTDWTEIGDDRAIDGGVDRGSDLTVTASWRLDRLVFDPSEIRLSSLGQQRARARATLAAQATALYYKRRQAEVDALWHPADSVEDQVRRELDLEELTAQLDALTGGWWSEHADE